jgi:hypothetical protein
MEAPFGRRAWRTIPPGGTGPLCISRHTRERRGRRRDAASRREMTRCEVALHGIRITAVKAAGNGVTSNGEST